MVFCRRVAQLLSAKARHSAAYHCRSLILPPPAAARRDLIEVAIHIRDPGRGP